MKEVLVSLSLSFCGATPLTRMVSKRNLLMNTPVLTDGIQRHAERVTTEATLLLCYDGCFLFFLQRMQWPEAVEQFQDIYVRQKAGMLRERRAGGRAGRVVWRRGGETHMSNAEGSSHEGGKKNTEA